jgi:hypothetical protein
MDKIEMAREMFQKLECGGPTPASEVAMRAFCIQDRLSSIRG